MTKRLFFLLGVIVGLLFAGIAIRKKMERLKTLEAEKVAETARFAAYNREREAELAAGSFERRMDWALFQASLTLDNGTPSWVDGEDDDEPQE
jgi:hypothetical protein